MVSPKCRRRCRRVTQGHPSLSGTLASGSGILILVLVSVFTVYARFATRVVGRTNAFLLEASASNEHARRIFTERARSPNVFIRESSSQVRMTFFPIDLADVQTPPTGGGPVVSRQCLPSLLLFWAALTRVGSASAFLELTLAFTSKLLVHLEVASTYRWVTKEMEVTCAPVRHSLPGLSGAEHEEIFARRSSTKASVFFQRY